MQLLYKHGDDHPFSSFISILFSSRFQIVLVLVLVLVVQGILARRPASKHVDFAHTNMFVKLN
ncbi:MAG: hypothetical protein ACI93R_001547 [Flavobacteriales bacterium]|jgi:hypothetical protein